MAPNSKTVAEPRIRIYHKKSRSGCKTCKIRRVKCDEKTPVCLRCQRGERECVWDSGPGHHNNGGNNNELAVLAHRQPGASLDTAQIGGLITTITTIHSPYDLPGGDAGTRAMEYFLHKSVPTLRQCKPSPLWDHLLQLCHHPGPIIREIALAIGQEQKTLESTRARGTPAAETASCLLYSHALRTLRRDLTTPSPDRGTAYAVGCLLLVVLESLRGSYPNILIHLRYCITVLQQQAGLLQTHEERQLLDEAAQLLETCVVSTMNSNLFSQDAALARQLIRGLRTASPAADALATIEQRLREKLSSALNRHPVTVKTMMLTPPTSPSTGIDTDPASDPEYLRRLGPEPLEPDELDQEQLALEAAVQDAIGDSDDTLVKAYNTFVLARNLLTIQGLRLIRDPSIADSPETLAAYQRVVDTEEYALSLLLQAESASSPLSASGASGTATGSTTDGSPKSTTSTSTSATPPVLANPNSSSASTASSTATNTTFKSPRAAGSVTPFSLGLGAISTLFHIATRCKDFYLRRRALLVLEMCPQREGVWTVARARFMARAVIRHEEALAAALLGRPSVVIPEQCRVSHTVVVKGDEADGERAVLRMFFRVRPGSTECRFEDVEMGDL